MRYKEIKVNLPKDNSESFLEFVESMGISDYYEILLDLSQEKTGEKILRDDTNIHVYLPETDLESELKFHIFLKATVQTEYFLESRLIESKEYEEAYKEFYKPFDVGKTLRIIPTWEKKSEEIITQLKKDNRIPLFLNPGLAFGTGHHETTKLMIERMETAMKGVKSVLDMGTGSGVLGIAAAILGAKKICAIDIDSNAVEACKFNRNENSLDTSIDFSVYEGGFDHEKVPLEYDLTLINITFAVISKNIENIKNIQTERILFSGLITEKREAAMELFTQKLGGNLLYEASLNDWILLDWKR